MKNRDFEADIREEAKRLRWLPSFLLLAAFNIFLSLAYFWPGFWADPFLSPLGEFLLEPYPSWLLVLLFFMLGVGLAAIPVWVANRLYFTRIAPLIFNGEKGSGRYYYLKMAQFMILFPLLYPLIGVIISTWDPITTLLLFLARKKGYQQGVEGWSSNIQLAAFYWYLGGFIFIMSVQGSFFIHNSNK